MRSSLLFSTQNTRSGFLDWPLQILLLPSRPRVLVEMPLNIPLLIVQRPRPNLKQPHAHPRSHLRQFHRLVPCLDKNMVPDLDRILNVLERDDAVSYFGGGFAGRE